MTRKTAEKKVKKALASSRCRGPVVLTEAEKDAFEARWEVARHAPKQVDQLVRDLEAYLEKAVAKIYDVVLSLKGPAIDWNAAKPDQVWDRVHRLIFARSGDVGYPCGEPIVNVVLAGPFDGKPHEYTCSRCGRPGHYTAPRFEGLSA